MIPASTRALVLLALLGPTIAVDQMRWISGCCFASRWLGWSSRYLQTTRSISCTTRTYRFKSEMVCHRPKTSNPILRANNKPIPHTHNCSVALSSEFLLSRVETALCEILQQVNQNDARQPTILLLGLSGGCDSVGLLHALVKILAPTFQLKLEKENVFLQLHAIHFDHQQRGGESDDDRAFVTTLCEDLGVPLHTFYWESGLPFSQDIGRNWRQNTMVTLLHALAPSQQGVILTAHHKDDSIESLLLKLLRGVHITNLSGIEPWMPIEQVIVGRPLIGLSKAHIQAFLESHQLLWRDDSSNTSDKYKRNRIRNELLPLMADIVGGQSHLEKRLDNLIEQSSELRLDLEQRAKLYLENAVDDYFLLPENPRLNVVEKEALHMWATEQMLTLPYDQLQRICHQLQDFPTRQQWTMHVGSGWNVVRNGRTLTLIHESVEPSVSFEDRQLSYTRLGPTESNDDGLVIQVQPGVNHDFILSTACNSNQWLFTPPWRAGHRPVKIKDFLRGQKVPLHLRGMTSIIHVKGTTLVVAIQEQDKNWIVDASFNPVNNGDHRLRMIL